MGRHRSRLLILLSDTLIWLAALAMAASALYGAEIARSLLAE
jgi:hypothetical protein